MLHIIGVSARSIRGNPLLLVFVGIIAAAGASNQGFDRLWDAHLLKGPSRSSIAGQRRNIVVGSLHSFDAAHRCRPIGQCGRPQPRGTV
jgi:hypothetical protein